MNKWFYIIGLIAVVAMASSSCGLRGYRREARTYEQREALVYAPSAGNEKEFTVAKNFCLDDDTSIVKMNLPNLQLKSFQLLNRWGQVVIATQGADFIPVKMFPVPPAGMADMSVMTWRLSFVGPNGVFSHFQGNTNYLGAKCKK